MTMPEQEYGRLLRRMLIATALCIAAVLVCYFWIDRPVAFFVYRHHINKFQVFRWLTYPPPEVQTWSPLVLTAIMVRRAWGPFVHWQKVLLVACLSLIVADQFRIALGDVCGRYWPDTWTHDNPSLIGTGTYGFHPFQRGDDIGSFPSGHACRILGFATVWMIATPRSRVVVTVICAPMLVSLVAMNYHFVSDVIAGSILGAIIATYAAHLARLQMPLENPGLVRAVRQRHGQVANNLREAMIYRSVLASLCVEAFSLERLRKLSMDEIHQRYEMFKTMSQFELPE